MDWRKRYKELLQAEGKRLSEDVADLCREKGTDTERLLAIITTQLLSIDTRLQLSFEMAEEESKELLTTEPKEPDLWKPIKGAPHKVRVLTLWESGAQEVMYKTEYCPPLISTWRFRDGTQGPWPVAYRLLDMPDVSKFNDRIMIGEEVGDED